VLAQKMEYSEHLQLLKVSVPLGKFWRQFFCSCLLMCHHLRSVGKFMNVYMQFAFDCRQGGNIFTSGVLCRNDILIFDSFDKNYG